MVGLIKIARESADDCSSGGGAGWSRDEQHATRCDGPDLSALLLEARVLGYSVAAKHS